MLLWKSHLKLNEEDFPCGPVVKNPPSSAEDAGSIPGGGTKIPCCEATKPARDNFWACKPQWECPRAPNYRAHAPQLQSPHATTRENPARWATGEKLTRGNKDPTQPKK